MKTSHKSNAASASTTGLRLLQILVSLIPLFIGFTSLLNNIEFYHDSLSKIVDPLISMTAVETGHQWRALPLLDPAVIFIPTIIAEFLVGIFALFGLIAMINHIKETDVVFEKAKQWVYVSCGWGILVFGLAFFELAQDWFFASDNPHLRMLQPDGLSYAMMIFIVFAYLKMASNSTK
jgi:predicted small integral membrane protein